MNTNTTIRSTMDTVIATKQETLNRSDRCNATCPAAAMVRVTTKDLGEFLFCGHHWDLNKDVMPGVIHVHDERNPIERMLDEVPSPTSPPSEEPE